MSFRRNKLNVSGVLDAAKGEVADNPWKGSVKFGSLRLCS